MITATIAGGTICATHQGNRGRASRCSSSKALVISCGSLSDHQTVRRDDRHLPVSVDRVREPDHGSLRPWLSRAAERSRPLLACASIAASPRTGLLAPIERGVRSTECTARRVDAAAPPDTAGTSVRCPALRIPSVGPPVYLSGRSTSKCSGQWLDTTADGAPVREKQHSRTLQRPSGRKLDWPPFTNGASPRCSAVPDPVGLPRSTEAGEREPTHAAHDAENRDHHQELDECDSRAPHVTILQAESRTPPAAALLRQTRRAHRM